MSEDTSFCMVPYQPGWVFFLLMLPVCPVLSEDSYICDGGHCGQILEKPYHLLLNSRKVQVHPGWAVLSSDIQAVSFGRCVEQRVGIFCT